MDQNLNSKKTLAIHKNLIENKKLLRNVYVDFYKRLSKIKVPEGTQIEIGSGSGFIKKIIPEIITSDIVQGPNINKVFSAEKIPYKKESVSAFYMLNTFHHIKNPTKALTEMQRCLKPTGKIIMIEPYNSLWARFIFQNFHHENFDPKAKWKITGEGRLSGANGALPWIVFVRDKDKFTKMFPLLKISQISIHTPLSYLVSGGLSRPQILPTPLYIIIILLEKFLHPFNRLLGMFVTINLQKKA